MSYFLITLKGISSKNFLLVVSEILRLFVKMLKPDDNYSLSVKASVERHQFKCNYVKIKEYFPSFLLHFRNLHKITITLKKIWASEVISFWNYRLQKAGLVKSLKRPLSEHLWTVNMLKGPKDCLNKHGTIFLIFFITLIQNQHKKFFFSNIWYLKTVC